MCEDNKFSIIKEDLETHLQDNEDYNMVKIKHDHVILLEAKNPRAFTVWSIYSKIIARIVFYDCKISIASGYYKATNPEDDCFLLQFQMESTRNKLCYNGIILVIRNF